MDERKSYAVYPNSVIWGISSVVLFSSFYCLMKAAILWSEHMIFLASPSKYLFMLKIEIGQKLPSNNWLSVSWLAV